MKVTICDLKNCGKVIVGEPVHKYSELFGDTEIIITVTSQKDLCAECIRVEQNRAALQAHDALKRTRKVAVEKGER